MRHALEAIFRVALFACICLVFWGASVARLANAANLGAIVGGVLLTFPAVQLGRAILDRRRTPGHAAWTTTFMHCTLTLTFGVPIVRAIVTHQAWRGWVIPLPPSLGLVLVLVTGTATLLTVANLALKGLGAPFFVVLSRKLAVDWLYARTRNPMVLAALSFFVSLGLWFQSALFVLWVLLLIAPALLFFVKVFEERELELRFGASYLEYRSRTPMLFPRKSRSPKG